MITTRKFTGPKRIRAHAHSGTHVSNIAIGYLGFPHNTPPDLQIYIRTSKSPNYLKAPNQHPCVKCTLLQQQRASASVAKALAWSPATLGLRPAKQVNSNHTSQVIVLRKVMRECPRGCTPRVLYALPPMHALPSQGVTHMRCANADKHKRHTTHSCASQQQTR